MIPKLLLGQCVKIYFYNNIIIEGKVLSWSEETSEIEGLNQAVLTIFQTERSVMMVQILKDDKIKNSTDSTEKIIHNKKMIATIDQKERRQDISQIFEKIVENKLKETKKEKKIVSEFLNSNHQDKIITCAQYYDSPLTLPTSTSNSPPAKAIGLSATNNPKMFSLFSAKRSRSS